MAGKAAGQAQAAGKECGLTLRSSGPPPARHLGREPASVIIGLAAQAPCRFRPLSSNVRQQVRRVCELTNATAEAWPLNAAQERGDSAVLSLSAQGKENRALCNSSTTSMDGWRSSKRTKVQGVSSRHSVSRSRTRRTPSFPVFVPPSSPRSRRLARTEAALPGPCQRPRAAADSQVIRGKCRGLVSAALQGYVHSGKLLPNPSLEATATGRALGPRRAASYHARRGPSALPLSAPQLKR